MFLYSKLNSLTSFAFCGTLTKKITQHDQQKTCVVNLYKQQFVKKMGQKSSIPLTGDALMSQSITFPSSEAVKNTLLSSG